MAVWGKNKSFFRENFSESETHLKSDTLPINTVQVNTTSSHNDRDYFNIIHQNIQCITNKLQKIELFLATVTKTIHVLAITEHWLDAGRVPFVSLHGYRVASCYVRQVRSHGGSCLFVREGIEYLERDDLRRRSVESVIECSAIEVKHSKLIIINIYRPPSGDVGVFF